MGEIDPQIKVPLNLSLGRDSLIRWPHQPMASKVGEGGRVCCANSSNEIDLTPSLLVHTYV